MSRAPLSPGVAMRAVSGLPAFLIGAGLASGARESGFNSRGSRAHYDETLIVIRIFKANRY
jgi:hypothetical protein